jgi:hypothetical protein
VRTHVTFTREGGRRLDAATLAAAGPARHAFVCSNVRAERFGGAA